MKLSLFVFVIVFALSCKSSDKNESGSGIGGTAASATPIGATGAGDKSGTSITNAMLIEPGKVATGMFPCAGSLVVGPFVFTQDPSKIQINVTATNTSTEQACLGGSWVDAKGKFAGATSIGCLNPGTSRKAIVEIEYSPSSGIINANPMYLDFRYGQTIPPKCKPVPLEMQLL